MSDNVKSPLKFSTVCNIVPVTIDGNDYELREATGEASITYINARAGSFRIGKEGQVAGIGKIGNLAPLLVSLTLFDSEGKNVPEKTVRGWPTTIQDALYDRSQDLSNLREVNAVPIASLERALEAEGSPIRMADLTRWVMDHTNPKDDKPLRSMIQAHVKDRDSEEEEGNS